MSSEAARSGRLLGLRVGFVLELFFCAGGLFRGTFLWFLVPNEGFIEVALCRSLYSSSDSDMDERLISWEVAFVPLWDAWSEPSSSELESGGGTLFKSSSIAAESLMAVMVDCP